MATTTFTGMQSAQGLTFTNNNTDIVQFLQFSTAGNAVVTNNTGGTTYFYDAANAGTAQIDDNGGLTFFSNTASADHASINNHNGGFVDFRNMSTAGSATLTNGLGGTTYFEASSSAGNATINNTAGATYFQDTSTASGAAISNTGAGFVDFRHASTAGNATILNDASALAAGTTGSYTDFENDSTAGDSTITSINGGRVVFYDHSTGGNARLITNGATSSVEFSLSSGPAGDHKLSAGSISGSGTIYLGANALTVGSLGLDDTVSGQIVDGGRGGGMGASLIKTGSGTLTLSGNNTYSGGTTLVGGTLDLASSGAAGSGGVTFTTGAQTLRIEAAALGAGPTHTFATTLAGFGADGDVLDLRGIGTNASVSFNYLTDTLTFTNAAHTTLATVHLTGSYAGYAFAASSDGVDGTKVTVSIPVAVLSAALAHDTGSSATDGVTSDPTLAGQTNAGATLTFAEGANTLGSLTTVDGSYSFAFNGSGLPTLADGAHTITVTENFLGQVAKTTTVTLTLDGAAPGVPSLALTQDTGSSAADRITSDATLTVTPAESGGSLAYVVDGQAVASYDPTTLSQGAHTVSVTQTDLAGNSSTPGSVSFTLDSVAPGAPSVALANDTGSSSTDRITRDGTLTVTPAEAGGRLTYTVDGQTVASYDPTTLSQGAHTVSVTQTDDAGNMSALGSIAFTLDGTAPGAPTLALANDTGFSSTDRLTHDATLIVTPTEPDGTLAYVVDGQAVASYDPTSLGQGPHTVSVTQTDVAGNVSAAGSLSFTLDNAPPGTLTLALANDTGISGTDRLTRDASLVFIPSEPGGSLAYTVDGQAVASYDPASLSQGAHTVSVTQTDLAGNISAAGSLSFTLDSAAPGAPSVALANDTGSSSTDRITRDAALTVTPAEAGGSLAYVVDGQAVAGYDPTSLSQGAHTVSVTQTDDAGNVSAPAFLTFTLDGAAPGTPSVTLTDDTGVSDTDHLTREATLTVTPAEPGGSLAFTVDGQAVASYDPASLSQGAHTVSVTQIDAAGNASAAASLAFTLDSQAPALAIAAVSGATNLVDHVLSGSLDPQDGSSLVTIRDGMSLLGTVLSDAQGQFSLPFTFADDGLGHLYHLTASATDLAGNTGASDSFDFALDFTPNQPLFGTIAHDAQSAGGAVYALYDGLLARAPDPLGFASWSEAVDHGLSLHDAAQGFLASPEFTSRFGEAAQMSDATFVEALYRIALGREADATGEQNWLDGLAHGLSRADVALDFALSAENQAQLAPAFQAGVFVPDASDAEVARLYHGLLGRAPDASGLQSWEAAADIGVPLVSIAQAFLDSSEYAALHPTSQSDAQFVDSLYMNALGRSAEPTGLASWTDGLAHGLSRAEVALGIAESAEARNHLSGSVEQGWHLA